MRRILLGFSLIILVLLVLSYPSMRHFLYSWTGEEDLGEGLKGLGALFLIRLTNSPLNLTPYAPIAYTNLNPYAVNTFLEQEVEEAKVRRTLEMAHEAGFTWIRQEFPWEDIEIHAKGDFQDRRTEPYKSSWEKYDRIVALAEEYGLDIIARLDLPPAWARPSLPTGVIQAPPEDLNDFGDFVYTIVSRYRGRIKFYQIWNEPNLYAEWGSPPDSPAYTELLRLAYQRAKTADPEAVIISACLAPTTETGPNNLSDLTFLEGMYESGASDYFDIMCVQGYGLWTGPTDRRADPSRTNFSRPMLIRDIMTRNGDASKPIWAGEIGWNALPPDFTGSAVYGRVSEDQQARYAVEAYQRAQEEWPWMGVMAYWFLKRADDREKDQPFYYFRMLDPDFTTHPVYSAIAELANGTSSLGLGFSQEDHWALHYEGDWEKAEDEQATLGAYMVTQSPEASLSFVFHGTDLLLVVIKGPDSGQLETEVDGRGAGIYNLQSATPEYGVEISVAAGLADGQHRVEIVFEGPKGSRVAIDGFVVRRTSEHVVRLPLATLGGLVVLAALSYAVKKLLKHG